MCAFTYWLSNFMESQIFAAIVGALIGIFPAYWLAIWKEKRKDKRTHFSWLNGLMAELKHIEKCINEIAEIVQSGNPSTKRMNSDFLEQSRLKLFTLDKDTEFLECLTNAYRDIVHTNDMLDRFEKMAPNHSSFQLNVLASMKGVGTSVSNLKSNVEQKMKNIN